MSTGQDTQQLFWFNEIMSDISQRFISLNFPSSYEEADARVDGENLDPDLILSTFVSEMWEGQCGDRDSKLDVLNECLRLIDAVVRDAGNVRLILWDLRHKYEREADDAN